MSDEAPEQQNENEAGAENWQERFTAQQKVNRDLERSRKAELKQLDSLKAELAQLREGSAPKDEVAAQVDKVRKETESAVRLEVARERALDKIESKAAKLFADPEDARALLAGRVDEFLDSTSAVDAEAIEEALAELLKAKPHLSAKPASPWGGGGDGGPRGDAPPADTSPRGLIAAGMRNNRK